jgi:hypothetical protein
MTIGRASEKVNLQGANGVVNVKEGEISCIGNQVVDATLANNLGSIGSGLLEACVTGEVAMENVDIGTGPQLCRHLFSRSQPCRGLDRRSGSPGPPKAA